MTRSLRPVSTGLPVEAELGAIAEAVRAGPLVLTAAPGAGKSSLVPFAVDDAITATGTPGRVVMLQPRRLAARATATRLASLLGEELGSSVGLSIRGEHVRGSRIDVVTEAVLTNRLHRDPELDGVAAVIFDEFHERNLHSDLGLAMAIEAREALRPDLTLVVMSATIDPAPIAALLGQGTTVLDIAGRAFPIETEHRHRPARSNWAEATAQAASDAHRRTDGDVLVFAPGRRELESVVESVRAHVDESIDVVGLHGGSPAEVHRSVLSGGERRRIIVATAVAETSVTIPGITAVVDGGLSRRPHHDPATGASRLVTRHVNQFSAEQRQGRAGRTGPGLCIRMWSADDHRHLAEQGDPEVVVGDPLEIAAQLLRWGDPDARHLSLIDRPDPARLAEARATMSWWGFTDGDALTEVGAMALQLPAHPRVAALLAAMSGVEAGLRERGLVAAALLEDNGHAPTDDLAAEIDQRRGDQPIRDAVRRLDALSANLQLPRLDPLPTDLGQLLAAAWPDRLALPRSGDTGRLLMANGREAALAPSSPLRGGDAYVVVDTTVEEASGRVRRAVRIDRSDLTRWQSSVEDDNVEWDRKDRLVAKRRRRIGALVLHVSPLNDPDPAAVQAALRGGLAQRGVSILRWTEADELTRRRLAWLHEQDDAWPSMTDEALLDRIDEICDLASVRTVESLRAMRPRLLDLLDWELRAAFDQLAPTELAVPSGRMRRIDWSGERPTWPVRVQDLFGLDEHPTIGPNAEPLTIELLSPAGRTTQTTTDLPGFWRGSYAAVRADLRGRYPKHPWPEDPLA